MVNLKHVVTPTLVLILALSHISAYASDNQLTGVSSFSKFYREQFIAALYLSEKMDDSEAIINSESDKRMVMLISAEELSSRKFRTEWGLAIEMNNLGNKDLDQVSLKGGGLDDFLTLPKKVSDGKFYTNDVLSIELSRSKKTGNLNTFVKYNEKVVIAKKGATLFRVLLRGWIGQNPPSTDFKNQLLGKDRLRNHDEVVYYLKSATRTS